MQLTPRTPDADLAALSAPERTSERRRRQLERLAGICSPRSVDVSVTLERETALCRPGDEPRSYEICLPTRAYEQFATSIPDRLWNRRIQTAFLFHELGHAHYSDFERFGDRLDDIGARWRELFRTVYNAAEDGVVETQMAAEFNVRADLLLLNATLSERADRRHARFVDLFDAGGSTDTLVRTYTVFEAVSVGLLDMGFGNSGRYAEILDPDVDTRVVRNGRRDVLVELDPVLREYMAGMLSEPVGRRRVDSAFDCFRSVRDALAELPPLQRRRVETTAVRPPDVHAVPSWHVRPADELPDETTATARVASTTAVGDDGMGRNDDATGPGVDGESSSGSGTASGVTGPVPGYVARGALRRIARRRSIAGGRPTGGGSPLEREAGRLLAVVRDADTDVDEVIVVDPEPDGGDRDRWERAGRHARKLTADLRTRLRRERRPRDDPGHRVGRLDAGRVVDAYRGRDRVFSRRLPGRRKDYSCLLLLDRSGSMRGREVVTAENAVAQLAIALHAVGVDVSILSVWQNTPCLELPFGGDPGDHVDRLLTERAGGGTPFSDLLSVARHRLSYGSGSVPFVVVVTDGQPDCPGAYREQLDRCSVPVYGVYVTEQRDGDPALFDRLTYAAPDELERTLGRLVRRLFDPGGG